MGESPVALHFHYIFICISFLLPPPTVLAYHCGFGLHFGYLLLISGLIPLRVTNFTVNDFNILKCRALYCLYCPMHRWFWQMLYLYSKKFLKNSGFGCSVICVLIRSSSLTLLFRFSMSLPIPVSSFISYCRRCVKLSYCTANGSNSHSLLFFFGHATQHVSWPGTEFMLPCSGSPEY